MSYLDIARSALAAFEKSEESPSETEGGGLSEVFAGEESEESRGTDRTNFPLEADEAERLKASIIAAVTVEPAVFDRTRYEALTARWDAHERALARRDSPSDRIGAEARQPSPPDPHAG